MRINKDIRRLAFQTLYQLDARNGEHRDEVRAQLAGGWKLEAADEHAADPKAIDAAWMLAEGAWEHRQAADEELALLAPDWPTSRLAAVDRAILRLAHYEMTAGAALGSPPKVAVNDAINLAKEFSTDRAPAFINGLLGTRRRR
jgi:N utilization substance protein B